jgi:hypothetical protein
MTEKLNPPIANRLRVADRRPLRKKNKRDARVRRRRARWNQTAPICYLGVNCLLTVKLPLQTFTMSLEVELGDLSEV